MSPAGREVHFKAMRKLAAEHSSEAVGTFEICIARVISRFYKRFKARLHQSAYAAAQVVGEGGKTGL